MLTAFGRKRGGGYGSGTTRLFWSGTWLTDCDVYIRCHSSRSLYLFDCHDRHEGDRDDREHQRWLRIGSQRERNDEHS